MLSSDQRERLIAWGQGLAASQVRVWLVARGGRTITRAPALSDALDAVDSASSLDARVATYQILALGEHDDDEVARIDVRIDPKALAVASESEAARAAHVVTAQAAAIAASDHKGVATAVKSTAEALGESHRALVAMVRAFGDAGGAMLKSHGEAVVALDARAARAEKRLSETEQRLDAARDRERELTQMLQDALAEAERLKRNSQDLVEVLRATFGPKVDAVLAGLQAASAGAAEGPAS